MSQTSSTSELTPKQERFCVLYASDKEFFGNGVQAYIEAYDPDTSKPNWYKSCLAASSRLLTNVKVLKRIDELLELRGLNDPFVDKQLELLITQNADYKTKIAAIREYNSLKKRITQRVEVTNPIDEILKKFGISGGDDARETEDAPEGTS